MQKSNIMSKKIKVIKRLKNKKINQIIILNKKKKIQKPMSYKKKNKLI